MPALFHGSAIGPAWRHAGALSLLLMAQSCSPGEQADGDSDGPIAAAEASAPSPDAARAIAALGERCSHPGLVRPRGHSTQGDKSFAVQCGEDSWLVTLSDGRNAQVVDCELAEMQGQGCW